MRSWNECNFSGFLDPPSSYASDEAEETKMCRDVWAGLRGKRSRITKVRNSPTSSNPQPKPFHSTAQTLQPEHKPGFALAVSRLRLPLYKPFSAFNF